MYAKLDKLREDLKKAVAKRDAAEAKVKRLEEKLREEENQQIVSDVASYNLTPEQLAQFLQLANSGKLQAMISGQIPMPVEEHQRRLQVHFYWHQQFWPVSCRSRYLLRVKKQSASARKSVRMNLSMRTVRFAFMTITSVRAKKQRPLKKIMVH